MQPPAAAQPLVATKLFVPRLRPNRVDRARLRDRLDQSRHMVLVSAPAGSGKSTLLADWTATCGERVAWLSLDGADDEPRRFVNYLLAALRTAEVTSWSEIDASRFNDPQALRATLTEVLNDVASASARATLVVDDYHVIESGEIHSVVEFIIDHLPPNLRIVVSTRADPPLSLSRLRARDSLTEIRASDLRFSTGEAADFLTRSMGLELGDREVEELERRTEGWAVGLQMAAISLRGKANPDEFISQFTGSNRYVLDYLTDEVVAGQPDHVRDFLVQTSILGRLSAPLCNAVTGREDSSAILSSLDASNLFLIALDDVRYWYRYHHLFATLLQHHLERTWDAASIRRLHQRASEWYAANGFPDAAIDHALLADDKDRVRALVAAHTFALIFEGETNTVERWLNLIPEEDRWNSVDLLVYGCVVATQRFRFDEAERLLSRAEELVNDEVPKRIRAGALTMRGIILRTQLRNREALGIVERAYQLSDPGTPLRRAIAFEVAMGALPDGDLVRTDELLAFHDGEKLPPRNVTIAMSQSIRAEARLLRGDPDEAVVLANQLVDWVDRWDAIDRRGKGLSSMAYPVLSDVYRAWNDLPAARAFAEQGIGTARRGFHIGIYQATLSLIHVAAAEGKWAEADQLMEKVLRTMRAGHMIWTQMAKWVDCATALRRGTPSDVDRVASVIAAEGFDQEPFDVAGRALPGFFATDPFLVSARLMMRQERTDLAIGLLDQVVDFNRRRDCVYTLVEALILRAIAGASADDMLEAVDLASRPRFIRLFLDEGPGVATLIERAIPRVRDRNFATRLLAAFDTGKTISDVLSEREVEVLRLIAAGASNQDAGKKLFISPSTVKKHLENIYAKLAVGGRTQAIARARELRLL